MLVCKHCGKDIGIVAAPQKKVMVDETEDLLQRGTAARCPLCRQVVEVRTSGSARTFVPHYAKSEPGKICPSSGKPVNADPPTAPSPLPRGPASKDLRAFMACDSIKVVSFGKGADARIEELTLEYLDKSDRVRLQIEALRAILGPVFRMKPYPPQLHKPDMAVWGTATVCVLAKKHEHGGFQQMTDTEVTAVLEDLRQFPHLFFR